MALRKPKWLTRIVGGADAAPVEAAPDTPAPDLSMLPADTDPVVAQEDGMTSEDTPAIVYLREPDGSLSRCRVKFGRVFSFTINGRQAAHVETAPDGVWIYEVRSH